MLTSIPRTDTTPQTALIEARAKNPPTGLTEEQQERLLE